MTGKKKKVVILDHGWGELANQLWNAASVYAYCLERGFAFENWSFFEYQQFFKEPAENVFLRLLSLPLRNYSGRKTALRRHILRKIFSMALKKPIWLLQPGRIVSTGESRTTYLPPTENSPKELVALETGRKTIYLTGWYWRNPSGLIKYRNEILAQFAPRESIRKSVEDFLVPLRAKYEHIIGVHIRQGDYATWQGGKYLLSHARIRETLDEYLARFGFSPDTTCFVIASDGKIEVKYFQDLHIVITGKSLVEDLFILSKADAVIGSNSSFGDMAAYLGNIPHIIVTDDVMEWEYYQNKTQFFENKYCTTVHY